jgi:endonuclease/exonuclease/phosphatase family metal-dependent hydrolase
VAGDFNCPAGDDGEGFARFLEVVHDRHGLTSAYHRWSGEAVGSETAPTHWWRGHEASTFHIDFVLVPKQREVTDVVVGSYATWAAPGAPVRSDHAPVIAELQAHQALAPEAEQRYSDRSRTIVAADPSFDTSS